MGPHWTGLLIVAILLLLLFGGRGKISAMMGDFAKGITAFRKGLKDGDGERSDTDETSKSLGAGSSAQADARREDERAGS